MVLMFGLVSVVLQVTHALETIDSPLIVCEDKGAATIKCNTSIVILSSVYGRTDNITCPSDKIKSTQCESNTSYLVVNNACTGKHICNVTATNNVYGDPCQGTYKYLNVTYKCADTQYTADIKASDNTLTIGIAVGVPLTVLLAFSLAGIFLFLRRRSKLNRNGNERIISKNALDYQGNQNIAMPDNERSKDYNELKIRINSHKYQDLKPNASMSQTLETSYDYIDTSQDTLSLKPHVFLNGNSYLTRVPENSNIEPAMAVKNTKIYGHDYLVLDPNENGFDKSRKTATPSNESYVILDPTITGYNRSLTTLSEQNGYELAKPTCIIDDKNRGTVKQAADLSQHGGTGTCYSTTNVQKRNQKSENIYSHAVDNVYDTTKHDKKEGQSDNAYDHFFGQKTEGDYDMAEKH